MKTTQENHAGVSVCVCVGGGGGEPGKKNLCVR